MERVVRTFKTEIGGRPFEVEVGKVANLANGSGLMKYGETTVLCTATASKNPKVGIDFFPLSVDFEERMYSVGKIPGGFIKREARPSEKAILTSRLIDRPIRPLFPDGYFNEVQLICSVMSCDQDCTPDTVALIGASISLAISDIPFDGPIAGVVVGYVDGEYVINPTVEQAEKSEMHLMVAGTSENVMMIEAGANILPEKVILEAILFGHDEIKKICAFIETIVAEIGKEKQAVPSIDVDPELEKKVRDFITPKFDKAVRVADKVGRGNAMADANKELVEYMGEEFDENKAVIKGILKSVEKKVVRAMVTDEKIRPDGRTHDKIRDIACEVSLLPRTHGSGLFTRGLTQALTVATLGALGEAQRIDGLGVEERKRYMHHYNFPPFSVGETGFMRGPNRRAIGHGALGERALVPVLPTEEDFPYAIRLVSEVVTCNGSSSQASICGSTLSLLDAGVPIKAPVAGIAMGMMQEGDEIAILSDIQGLEDFMGDMDFKVAGTTEGITAIQMDIKIDGVSRDLMEKALEQARIGRLHILGEMAKVMDTPRAELSEYAPRVLSISIHPDKIRDVIGPGGKVIQKITAECDVKIDINDDGLVLITSATGPGGEEALKRIEMIVKDVEVNQVYKGKVTRLMKFGAFVELIPGKEGLCHISQIAKERVSDVEDVLSVGDIIDVKVTEIDKQGRINLSRKVLLMEADK